jgi:hypothetical protein
MIFMGFRKQESLRERRILADVPTPDVKEF